MPNVVRFTFNSTAEIFVPGVGVISRGVFDVLQSNTTAVTAVRSALAIYSPVETVVDTSAAVTPQISLPDPYPQYVTDADLANPMSGPSVAMRAAYMPVTPVMEGLPLTMYGASYEGADTVNTVGTRYPTRAARRLGMTLTNRGVSGMEMADMFHHMVQLNSPGRFIPGTKGVVFLAGMMNDILREPNLVTRKETFKQSLKACIWRAFCSTVISSNDASIVASGTTDWSQQSVGVPAGYSMAFKQSTVAGATLTIPTAVTRDIVLFGYLLATEKPAGNTSTLYAGRGPQFSIAVDSTTKADHITPAAATTTGSPRNWTAAGLATPVLDLPNQAHSIVFTNHQDAGGGTRAQAFDSLGVIDRTSIPQVVISKGIKFDPARPPSSTANTDVDVYRGYVDEAVAEVIAAAPWAAPAITVYDPNTAGWVPTAMVGSDQLHSNDLGQSVMANALVETLAGLPFRNGMTK